MRDRIAIAQHGAQPVTNEEGNSLRHRAGDADDPLVGFNLHKVCLDDKPTLALLAALKVLTRTILRVNSRL
jgi:hypothetical protein